jgi:tetratricopeptide (TPR) repeat protein
MMTSLLAILLATTLLAPADDSLAAARDLYTSAAYEEALALLDRLPQSNQPLEVTRAVEQYRALCLLALGRNAEAEHAIEAVIAGDPSFRPAADVSPRVRATFSDVRRRVLPAMIQQTYASAKSAFDRKEFANAASTFTQMLVMMTDPDAEAAAARPPLSDLRTLASGFRDLATAAAAPPPPPPPPPPAPEPVAATPPMPPVQSVPRVYTLADGDVVPPVTIRQQLPAFPGPLVMSRQGMIDVLIDERGVVQGATMTQSINAQYDAIAVAAAKRWRYEPATLNGTPVKYRKAVQVSVKPR